MAPILEPVGEDTASTVRQRKEDKGKQEQDSCCGNSERAEEAMKKRAEAKRIRWTPIFLLMLFVMPACLPFIFSAFDKFARTDWGIALGLYEHPKIRLERFYRENNPSKLHEVDTILKKYKGREDEMFAKLEAKYERIRQQREEAEYYGDN
mmetsp:Transcript_4273/g.6390  ORF Transcript_4273/g.6390 Transcript_4273/m.6390 type:complete len:151 (-) Transcript_4273:125-577(-)|eukprot:CAMPEP_0113943596 /NCGR_PEP_ID=MMETSP1339-20121228/26782_1 /TAXON_ID=94617 /ORGANISM="Fibrocapsa japonica" /LENGTH=150 /DNA_ID=CAMNT_0000948505 /DNA_START=73 /DNA_END=525 /DNA_ORIENTATION=+ /assembly_acc=CAM_ASM_000762